jgi:hypothetical protein
MREATYWRSGQRHIGAVGVSAAGKLYAFLKYMCYLYTIIFLLFFGGSNGSIKIVAVAE